MDTNDSHEDRIGVSGTDIVERLQKPERTAPKRPKQNTSTQAPQQGIVRKLRTYDNDLAESLRGGKFSVAKIAIQEKTAKTSPSKPPEISEEKGFELKTAPKPPLVKKEPTPEPPKPIEKHKEFPNTNHTQPSTVTPQKPPVAPRIEKKEVPRPTPKQKQVVQKKERKPLSPHVKNILHVTVLAILGLFIVGGIGYGGFVLYSNRSAAPIPYSAESPLIRADLASPVGITSLEGTEAVSLLRGIISQTRPEKGKLAYIYPSEEEIDTVTGRKISRTVPAGELFTLFSHKAPPSLVRTFEGPYMTGVYGADTPSPFLLIQVDFYKQALAGMLSWETTLARDIELLFGKLNPETETQFNEVTVDTIDARALMGVDNSLYLLYGFPNEDLILITTTKEAFTEITQRIKER